jgi:hypothetical protein
MTERYPPAATMSVPAVPMAGGMSIGLGDPGRRWTVHAATGHFADTTGPGSETGASAGAHLSASYTAPSQPTESPTEPSVTSLGLV